MVLEEHAERGDVMPAGETGGDRSIWKIIIGVFASPSEAFNAYNQKSEQAPEVKRNPTVAAILAFLFSPIGMVYVKRFWVAFGIMLIVEIVGGIAALTTKAAAPAYLLYLAYAVGMAVWAYQTARAPRTRVSRLDKALVVVLIVGVVWTMAVNYFLTAYNSQAQAELVARSSTLPPQIIEKMQQDAANPNRFLGAVTAGFGEMIMLAIAAFLAWGAGGFLMGGESKFKRVWGVTMLGGMITLLGSTIKLPLMAAKQSIYVSFGLAALFPNKDFTSILYWLMYFFDGFVIWSIIVAGIGYGVVFNISRGKGIAVSAISTVIMVMIYLALMIVGMSFAGVKLTFF